MEEALVEAVKLGVHAEVESILAKGVNPNIVDEDGVGLLHYSASVDDSKLTAMLLKYGCVRIETSCWLSSSECGPIFVFPIAISHVNESLLPYSVLNLLQGRN